MTLPDADQRRKDFIRWIERDLAAGLTHTQILYRYRRGLGEDEIHELIDEASQPLAAQNRLI